MQRIHVVAAVIYGSDGRILIARRPDHLHKGGLWEFPGGKVDEGESAREALVRELHEELAIDVTECEPFTEIHHDYPEKSVFLDFWKVTAFDGEPKGNEGQPIEWVALDRLADYPFPEANQAIVEKIARRREEPSLPKVHKGYVWSLLVIALVAVYLYLERREFAQLDDQQKLDYYWYEARVPQHIKDIAGKYSLEELERLCEAPVDLPEGEEYKLLRETSLKNKSEACQAAGYIKEKAELLKST